MSIGFVVDKNTLDANVAQAIIGLRNAFEHIDIINAWLTNQQSVNNVDPLSQEPFNYTDDEVYALRLYFQTFDTVRSDNQTTFDIGRKMTGLA